MSKVTSYRPARLGLALLIGTFSALVALAVSGGHDAEAHGTHSKIGFQAAEAAVRSEQKE